MNNFNTPVLFLIFNRLDTTKQVFSVIQKVKPKKIYIASDGPRISKAGEKEIVDSVRKYVLDNINWECEIKTLFRENNLGCKIAVSSAITWFFKNEEQGIILEDDCLPDLSFFKFCDELLEKYKNDERIAIISGDNFNDKKIGEADYYFKRIPHTWGWATWKNIWDKYDIAMPEFQKFENEKKIKNIWSKKTVQKYWMYIFKEAQKGKTMSAWDYQFTFFCFSNGLLSISPKKNLVRNLGLGGVGTHTVKSNKYLDSICLEEISFPLNHPYDVEYEESNDSYSNKMALHNFKIKIFLKNMRLLKFIKRFYKYFLK